jgi:type I restriction enzyme, S subunit
MLTEWQEVALGDVCRFQAGSVFKPELQGHVLGDFPFVKVSDMNLPANVFSIQQANNWISRAVSREIRAKPLPTGTVVFAKIGEALRQNRLRRLVRPTVIDNNMMGATPTTQELDARFFYYAMSRFDFSTIAQGTALPYLTVASLSQLTIPLPGLTEQHAIARILGTLDDKIELNRRTSNTLEAMARSLFKSWFIDFDPVALKNRGTWRKGESVPGLPAHLYDLFPDRLVESELGEIPEGWISGELDLVAVNPRRGVKPGESESDTPYIALEHMPRRSLSLMEWSTAEVIKSAKYCFNRGDLLFGKLRPYFHKVAIAPVDGVCSTDILVIAPREQACFSFVTAVVSSDAFVEFTNAGSTGTKMPRTSWNEMKRYNLVVPPMEVMREFEIVARTAHDQLITLVHESRRLSALRDTLLPKLISGELRVKDAERIAEAVL